MRFTKNIVRLPYGGRKGYRKLMHNLVADSAIISKMLGILRRSFVNLPVPGDVGMLVDCCACVVGLLHGDMSQVERNEVITAFKHKSTPILTATDVAGMLLASCCNRFCLSVCLSVTLACHA